MKRIIITMFAIVVSLAASAQSTNPLNYSGTMYVASFIVLEAPRYVSYEEHAILTEKMVVPMVEITKVKMDFEKCKFTLDGKENDIKVTECKKYTVDYHWEVVVYFEYVGGDRMELVWPEFGSPYLQQITKTDDGVNIARLLLSNKPVVSSPEDALMDLFQGLGGLL